VRRRRRPCLEALGHDAHLAIRRGRSGGDVRRPPHAPRHLHRGPRGHCSARQGCRVTHETTALYALKTLDVAASNDSQGLGFRV